MILYASDVDFKFIRHIIWHEYQNRLKKILNGVVTETLTTSVHQDLLNEWNIELGRDYIKLSDQQFTFLMLTYGSILI